MPACRASASLRDEASGLLLSAVVLFAGDLAACEQVVAEVGGGVAAFFGNPVTLKHFAKCSEDDLHIAKEGDFLDIFKIVANFCFPGYCIATANLSKSAKSLTHGMAFALFGSHKDHVTNKLRSRANYSHVTLEDVEEFGEFVEAGATEELAVSIQANIVRKQVAVGVLFVCHRTELDKLEDFLVKARARLRKERVTLHLDGAENCEHDENRAQADDGRQSAEKIEGTLEKTGVHTYSKHSLMVWMMASCCSGVILLSLGRQSPWAKMSAPTSRVSPAM